MFRHKRQSIRDGHGTFRSSLAGLGCERALKARYSALPQAQCGNHWVPTRTARLWNRLNYLSFWLENFAIAEKTDVNGVAVNS